MHLHYTHKFQLLIDTADPEEKKRHLDTLYRWQNRCFRAVNHVLTHQFLQTGIKQLFYFTEEMQLRLAHYAKDAGVLTTSRENTTLRLLSSLYKGEVPIDFLTELNHAKVREYGRDREAYWRGEKVLAGSRRDLAMPFKVRSIKGLRLIEGKRDYAFTLFRIPLRTYIGRGMNKGELLRRYLAGELELRRTELKLKKGKLFLLATFRLPPERAVPPLNAALLAEVALSPEQPLVVRIGGKRYPIGSKEEFLYRRLAIQAALQRRQVQAAAVRGGHGRSRKLKAFRGLHDKERDYITTRHHQYSRRLVNLCIQHGAGTILLVNEQEKEAEARADAFLLRNWSFHGLKEKIRYKAQHYGIAVIEE